MHATRAPTTVPCSSCVSVQAGAHHVRSSKRCGQASASAANAAPPCLAPRAAKSWKLKQPRAPRNAHAPRVFMMELIHDRARTTACRTRARAVCHRRRPPRSPGQGIEHHPPQRGSRPGPVPGDRDGTRQDNERHVEPPEPTITGLRKRHLPGNRRSPREMRPSSNTLKSSPMSVCHQRCRRRTQRPRARLSCSLGPATGRLLLTNHVVPLNLGRVLLAACHPPLAHTRHAP